MLLKPTPPPLRTPHLERGLHHLLPSWRSLQSQLAHGSLSWPEERTGDSNRAAARQRPSPASSPQKHLRHKFSNAGGCQQVEGCWTGKGKAYGDLINFYTASASPGSAMCSVMGAKQRWPQLCPRLPTALWLLALPPCRSSFPHLGNKAVCGSSVGQERITFQIFIYLKGFTYLFLERREGRKKER